MNPNMKAMIAVAAYVVLAPLVGGLLAGIDRRITARMQGRFGPPILQPFYDVQKLFAKEDVSVNRTMNTYVWAFLLFIVVTGALFFSGSDLLLVIFALTLASIFLVLAAYSSNSPYATIGAERELIQMMAYEPMVLMFAMGVYAVAGTFLVGDLFSLQFPIIVLLPGIFLGFVYILTIKLRKSPFDLSTSHHGHQELVKGLTTEFSGPTLAIMEIAHWYENVFLLGFVFMFFMWNNLIPSIIVGVVVVLLVYFFEIFIDNNEARVKWPLAFKSSWIVAATLGAANLFVVYLMK